jgi:hypothetical protein
MVDCGPITFRYIIGRSLDFQAEPIPQVCMAIFTDKDFPNKDHHQVAGVLTDQNGFFHMPDIKPGEYRVVAKYDSLGVLNVKIRVVRWPRGGSGRKLALHMRPTAIDVTRFADYK